jgi:hypothetical protein
MGINMARKKPILIRKGNSRPGRNPHARKLAENRGLKPRIIYSKKRAKLEAEADHDLLIGGSADDGVY